MRALAATLSLFVSVAVASPAWGASSSRAGLLRMRGPVEEPEAVEPSREVTAPTAVQWPAERDEAAPEVGEDASEVETEDRDGTAPASTGGPPPPRPAQVQTLDVAVGLSPEAPGTKAERALLDRLEASILASADPRARVRRLRPGAGEAREICRQGKEDLVVMIGYVPDREVPVVLAHDCRLDAALELRSAAAVDEPELVGVLWAEHDALVREGVTERRLRRPIGRRARIIIGASVAVAVLGAAVGILVASALREETVVLKVGP